ncbi:MAG: Hpt domain-containing protein, partial [Pirellulales bacterium]|nr:Hpt domain-containing protein [Pirellulales bacterium]
MKIDLQRFHAAFFDEAAEHLAVMESALLDLERAPGDHELLHSIFRAAHSIKGASGTFGFGDIAGFTHHLESLLDRMRDGRIAPTSELVELLLRSQDVLAALVSAAKDGSPLPPELESIVGAIENAQASGPAAGLRVLGHGLRTVPAMPREGLVEGEGDLRSDGRAGSGDPRPARGQGDERPARDQGDLRPAQEPCPTREYLISFQPGPDLLRFGMDPVLVLRDLAGLGEFVEVSADTSRLPELEQIVPDQ